MKNRIADRLFGAESQAVMVGRFEVLESVGAGGMGVVYRAYDPRLGRQVALKLLHQRLLANDRERSRLLREAQALAKLSHPNVVQLYEVGEHAEGFFLAMEYVAGVSLRRWQRSFDRSWREVLAIYVQAGRGLAAAHDVGLVHRDFKPGNVLVGEDGRARVADFGLARGPGLGRDGPSMSRGPGHGTFETGSVTRTGARVGTPAYMSPEQRSGRELDAASDQFSFCVALWEALFADRPQADQREVAAEVPRTRQRVAEAPSSVRRALQSVLARGLRSVPEQRWSSLTELLAKLDHVEPHSSRWKLVSLVGVGAIGAWAWWTTTSGPHPVCTQLEAATPTMSTSAEDDIREAAAALRIEEHERLARSVNENLGRHVERWVESAEEVCGGTDLAEKQSPTADCLVSVAERFGHVKSVLRQESGALLGAPEALAMLIPPRACEQSPKRVAAEVQGRADAEAMRALTQARALSAAGHYDRALGEYERLEESLGENPSPVLRTRIELGRGQVHQLRGGLTQARRHYERGVTHATVAGKGSLAATAHAGLATVWADLGQPRAAKWDATLCTAQAAAEPQLAWPSECDAAMGEALAVEGEDAEAVEHLQRALEAVHPLFGQTPIRARLWEQALANLYADQGKVNAAREIYQGQRDTAWREYGPQHPTVLVLDFNLARLHFDEAMGSADEEEAIRHLDLARAKLKDVLHGFETVYGTTPRLASPLVLLAQVYEALGLVDEAMGYAERAVELQERLPLDHIERGSALSLAATLAETIGERDKALALNVRLAEVYGDELGGQRSFVWHNVAYFRCLVARCEGAQEALDKVDLDAIPMQRNIAHLYVDNVAAMIALSQGDGVYGRLRADRVLRALAEIDDSSMPGAEAAEAEARWSLARAARRLGEPGKASSEARAAVAIAISTPGLPEVLRLVDPELWAAYGARPTP